MARKQRPTGIEESELEAIGYIRVSTQEQADSGLSLEAQRAKIEALAAVNGWRLVDVYEDAGYSAKTMARPGLHAALSALRPGRVLLVSKLDRLTRSVRDLLALIDDIKDTGGDWASVQEKFDTTTATGRMMLMMMSVLSQWERETIAERTTTALHQKKVRRERLGTTPLGYKTTRDAEGAGVVETVADELETVDQARALRANGHTLAAIAQELERRGRKTKRGGKWRPCTVARILAPRYLEGITA